MIDNKNELRKEAIAPLLLGIGAALKFLLLTKGGLATLGGAGSLIAGYLFNKERVAKEAQPLATLIKYLKNLNPATDQVKVKQIIDNYISDLTMYHNILTQFTLPTELEKRPLLAHKLLRDKNNAAKEALVTLSQLETNWNGSDGLYSKRKELFKDWDNIFTDDVGKIGPAIKEAREAMAVAMTDLDKAKGDLKSNAEKVLNSQYNYKPIVNKIYNLHYAIGRLTGVEPIYEGQREQRLWNFVNSYKEGDFNAANTLIRGNMPYALEKLAKDLQSIYDAQKSKKGFDFSDTNPEVELDIGAESSRDIELGIFKSAVRLPGSEPSGQKVRRRRPQNPTGEVKSIQTSINFLTQNLSTGGKVINITGIYDKETRNSILHLFSKYPKVEELFAKRYGVGQQIVRNMGIMQNSSSGYQGTLAKALLELVNYRKTGKEPPKPGEEKQETPGDNTKSRPGEPTRREMMNWLQTKTFSRDDQNVRVYDALSERGFNDTDMLYLLDRLYLSKNLSDMARWNPYHIKSALENRFRGA